MPLLGNAAVAMWWNVAGMYLGEFHEWHSKEHLPERLSIPGFNRGSRWQREGTGEFFVIYELAEYETLSSPAYRARLDNPTPWSREMMPRHRDMVRSQCRVVASHGRGLATFMTTIRVEPVSNGAAEFEARMGALLAEVPSTPGITSAHLLRTDAPDAAPTEEQKIRGGDASADRIILVSGHDADALRSACSGIREALASGASARVDHLFRLVHAMVAREA